MACILLSGCATDATTTPRPYPAAIALVSGGGQTADAGTPFADPLTFKVTDATGVGVKDVDVTFAVTTGAAALNPAAATTDAQGLAKTIITADTVIGAITIAARADGRLDAIASLKVQASVGDGRWHGTTGQGLPVYMLVRQRVIDSLAVRLTATYGTSSCTGTIIKRAIPIGADGSFATELGLGFRVAFRGRFVSSVAVNGTFDGHSGPYAAVCGSTIILGSGAALAASSWEGSRQ